MQKFSKKNSEKFFWRNIQSNSSEISLSLTITQTFLEIIRENLGLLSHNSRDIIGFFFIVKIIQADSFISATNNNVFEAEMFEWDR